MLDYIQENHELPKRPIVYREWCPLTKSQRRFMISLAVCNYFAIIAYLIAALVGLEILENDKLNDMTIFTQAKDDWALNSWIDFTWADTDCPLNYEPIGSMWLGTHPGNFTKSQDEVFEVSGIPPDSNRYHVKKVEEKIQKSMWE